MKALLLRVLRRLAAAARADQDAEWRDDVRKLRQLHVETRLRFSRLEQRLEQRLLRRQVDGPATDFQGPRVPVTVDPDPGARRQATARPAADVPHEILTLEACPVCASDVWTDVCEYNKLLLLERGPDHDARVYDYALCHVCGIVFARRRPVGARYVWLLERFEEALGRVEVGAVAASPSLRSSRLTPEVAAALRADAARGVFVSEHEAAAEEGSSALLRDRLASAPHVEILTSLLALDRPRVLELRPRFGAIGAGLKRLCGAEVYGLPLFEGQQLLNREVYGHRVDHLLDYDRFEIPYDGAFDLIVSNHMLTHMLRPAEFLRTVHERLAPGGHLYLYNEPDDAEFLDHHESMIKVLNPFHFQVFDRGALLRALQRHGFDPVFVTHLRGNLTVLAVRSDRQDLFGAIPDDAREARLARYRTARDLAILRLPERLRPVFADEWEQIVERTLLAGLAELTPNGNVRIVREADPLPDDALV